MLDNDASRYGEKVLQAATRACNRLGLRLFAEEPNTSQFLQALDQYNSKFHRFYNDAKEEFKLTYATHTTRPRAVRSTRRIFLHILAGSDDVGLLPQACDLHGPLHSTTSRRSIKWKLQAFVWILACDQS